MLVAYERYLRSERTMTRINQLGNEVITEEKGLSDSGLHNQMRDLRTLFNAAREHYNNEDLGIYRIKHYPFRKYKVSSPPLTKKRNHTLEQVLVIRDCVTKPGLRGGFWCLGDFYMDNDETKKRSLIKDLQELEKERLT